MWNLGKSTTYLIEIQARGCPNSYICGGTAESRISMTIVRDLGLTWLEGIAWCINLSDIVALLVWLKHRKYFIKKKKKHHRKYTRKRGSVRWLKSKRSYSILCSPVRIWNYHLSQAPIKRQRRMWQSKCAI